MALDRAALTTYLTATYSRLLTEAGLALADTSDGLGPVLDEVATVVDAHGDLSAAWYQPLGRYFALRAMLYAFAVNMDVSDDEGAVKLSQQFSNVMKLLDAERRLVGWLVGPDAIDPDAVGSFGVVTVTADVMTDPECVSWP